MAQSSSTDQKNVYAGLSASCNDFAEAFCKELSSTHEGNIVSSPLSIHMILSLLSNGAREATLNELKSGLCHPDTDTLNEGFRSLMSGLINMKEIKLYIANAMYIQDGFELLSEFQAVGTNVFQSSIARLDFKSSASAADKINTWVRDATENQISDLVSKGDFDEDTKLVLVNAIYFKCRWLHPFDVKLTQKKLFHVSKTEHKLVPTMFKKANYAHGEIPSLRAKFIEIPYLKEDIVMIIVLPVEVDGLTFVQENFKRHLLNEEFRSTAEVELFLPRFKFETMVDLKSILRKIGLNVLFEDNADFGRISEIPLKVSKVLHKAVIDVNEEGTEAAAATVVQMRLRRMIHMPEQFLVNHPFMFVIEHKLSEVPLFVGSVRDITHASEKDEL